MTKIAFIGAGSVVFTKKLICDILQFAAFKDATLSLMDIDPERLKVTEILARRVVEQLKLKARVEASQDLKKACRGAKYVFTTIQVGGYKPATVTDFAIPRKYGLQQTIGDTLGVGGIFRALRTIPALVKVAQTMQDVGAPEPLLLNYANPMAMNCWGVYAATGANLVGLCHSVQGTSQMLADFAKLDYKDVGYLVAGINHMAFFLEFKYQGQDAYPLLFKILEDPARTYEKVRFEMMRRLGYFVTESSEHMSEYCPYFIHHGKKVIEEFNIPIDEYLRRCESIIATWEQTQKEMLKSNAPVRISRSVEYGAQIVNACVTGNSCVIYGNVRNDGLITNLPQGCCVEVPCLIDRQGVQPTHIGDLPPQLAALIRTNVNVQELTVKAALTGRREHIYHAVMMDPHAAATLTLDKIWAMCDELIAAHQRDGFLGEFQPVRKNTGRALADLQRVFVSADLLDESSEGKNYKLELNVSNETDANFNGAVAVGLDRENFTCSLPANLKLNLKPNDKKITPFTAGRQKAGEEELVINFAGDTPKIFARSFRLPRRQRFTVKPDEPLPLELVWGDDLVAKGGLSLKSNLLELELRVRDTNIICNHEAFWEESVVELFFAASQKQSAKITQIVVLPEPKNPIVMTPLRKKIAAAKAAVIADLSGYNLSLILPYEAAGLEPGKPFLFEFIIGVSAFGDAHGQLRRSWQDSHAPHIDMTRAAIIEVSA